MPFRLEDFIRLRPRVYHLTATMNVSRILRDRRLASAAQLYEASGRSNQLTDRRANSEVVALDGEQVHIRDQMPLHEGNVALSGGWGFRDLVRHLNQYVFFWPGKDGWMIPSARNYLRRYANDDCAVLVIDTRALCDANSGSAPQFCRFNSGSPRWTQGRASPRGPKTFVEAQSFPGRASDVVEFVFAENAILPSAGVDVAPVRELMERL